MSKKIIRDPAAPKTLADQARDILKGRQLAYVQVFDSKSLNVKTVMDDLARFCRANETTFHPDARAHAVLEGRREVWLRIQQHLNLDPDKLAEMYIKERKTEL